MTYEQWLGNDPIALKIMKSKYVQDDETFEEWLDRVSGCDEDVKRLIREKKFLFGGRILAGRGMQHKGRKVVYSNCFVIPSPEDNTESIYETAGRMAKIFSMGGGVGIGLENLAPRGAKINNTAKTTTGAVSFMPTYNAVGDVIGQEGRRAAMIMTITDTHPDLVEFINSKTDLDATNMANISVKISDTFMNAAINDEDWELSFERHTGEVFTRTVNAKEVLQLIAKNSWDTGEPGIILWSAIEEHNTLSDNPYFVYGGTNPCGELPLPSGYSKNGHYIWGGACNLGSMNLAEYVKDGTFQYEELRKDTKIAFKAMNTVLVESIPLLPYKELQESVSDWRMNGLGHMGLATAFLRMGIKYGSGESVAMAKQIQSTILNASVEASAIDALRLGTYKYYDWDYVRYNEFFSSNIEASVYAKVEEYGLANATFCTSAPTGSISMLFGVTSGIEPLFDLSYHRSDIDEDVFVPEAQKWLDENLEMIEEQGINTLPDYFVTAHNIPYEDRIAVQAVIQRFNDGAISSTINLPNSATVDDVYNLYIKAWEEGLKGVCVFRDGCRRAGVFSPADDEQVCESRFIEVLGRGDIIQVDDDVIGLKRKLTTGCGTLHCMAYFDPVTGDLVETYLSKGSTGGCENSLRGLSRAISLMARGGIHIDDIVDQMESTGVCPSYACRRKTKGDVSPGTCCPMAVGRALLDMHKQMMTTIDCEIEEEESVDYDQGEQLVIKGFEVQNPCPECGEELTFEGGCVACKTCGYSGCD